MAVTDLFAGEIATELLKHLLAIVRKSAFCRASAEELSNHIRDLLPIIQEIKYSGVELPQCRQAQLDRVSELLRHGMELSQKVLASNRWNVYKNLQLARKMEKLEKKVSRFVHGPMQAHILADVHHLRFDSAERFDRIDGSTRQIERQLGSLENLGPLGVSLEVGVRKVREILLEKSDGIFGICGIGGSGKTTFVKELCRDDQLKSYFNDRILNLTVSQSPNVEEMRLRVWQFLSETEYMETSSEASQWNLQSESIFGARALVVLDDVWSLSVLEQLIFRVPGCKTLVVSRSKFPTVANQTYEVELLNHTEAMALFCHSAFGKNSVPVSADERLVEQLVSECKGLPLALKVIGASLRGQPQMFWISAKNRLSRGEPIGESHEVNLLKRLETSISYLPEKVRECFLDLACFPEDKKIPLDVLINMWVEIHDIDEEEAFAILIELSEKNLLTIVKDARAGDLYSSYYTIFVMQHDVLRDLALHLSNTGKINQRKRMLMPRREASLPKEWERNADQPFNAQIVSLHTGEMKEMDWFAMDFPKVEVLVLNFNSSEYFLPPFINNMPRLRALILINSSTIHAVLLNLSVFANMPNSRSLWLEKISVPQLPKSTIPLVKLQKMSLVLSKIDNSFDQSVMDMPRLFPHLSELTIDHCIDLVKLPVSICWLRSLVTLSITNCHSLKELPSDLGMLDSLQILRVYACPNLKILPPGICQLVRLKYLDISQCVNLVCLPENFGRLMSLEKVDMRECSYIKKLPKSAVSLQSLRHVICDEEISWRWKELEMAHAGLRVQVVEESFDLDWLTD
uniref:RPW8 domain-containing protein n=1 Tax=Chenopodium quinoa TaxID=63459 RepID=A0A803MKN1_CHEQI